MVQKRLFPALITIVMLFTLFGVIIQSPNTISEAAFEKDAQETVADIGFGWNLGNTLDSYGSSTIGSGSLATETSWGNPKTTKAMIDTLKEEGITAIRVPVTWYNHMDTDYNINEDWMARVKEIVDYVIDNDLYCIINVHHDTGEKGWLKASSENLDTKKEMFTAIWEQVADEFKEYGDKLLFEGFNEILNDSSEWVNPDSEAIEITNELNQIFVDTVRASGGNNDKRNLICNTYCAGANAAITKNFVVPTDTIENRIIVEVHVYQPYYFTSEFYPKVTTWTKSEIYTYISNVYNQFVKNGIPVIVGEFGCVNKNNDDEILSWAKYYVDLCTEYGIKCFWWDDGGNYKIFNRKSLKWIYPDLFKTMLAASKGEEYVPVQDILGDANGDGTLSTEDISILQNYILKNSAYTDSIANCDMNSDEKINVIDLTILKDTVANSSSSDTNYCEDPANWTTWIDESEGGEAEVEYTDNGISLNVTSAGTYEWNVQASYPGLAFENGKTYKISFDAVTSKDVSLTYNAMQNHDSYTPYYSENISLSDTSTHIESTFTMTKDTDTNCTIAFNLGAKKYVPYSITIENLSLTEVTSSNSDSSGSVDKDDEDDTITGENLTADASSWTSWINEETEAAADISYEDDGITITVTSAGENEWDVQGTFPNLTLKEGAVYSLEFDYSADKEVSLDMYIQQDYGTYEPYYNDLISYTTEVTHYSAEFTMVEDTDDNVKCVFDCGGLTDDVPFTISIKNLSLVRIK